MFGNIPVTVIAQVKGKTTKENVTRNFAMMSPEGYRKTGEKGPIYSFNLVLIFCGFNDRITREVTWMHKCTLYPNEMRDL